MGHSLGAQIAGSISKNLRKLHPRYVEHGVPLITALDPAQPGFINVQPDFRLNNMDAIRVEVFHTNTATYGMYFILPNQLTFL